MAPALPAHLAACHPEQEAAGQQAVKEERDDAGYDGRLVECNEDGHEKPADGNDVHARNYACKSIDSAERGMENR